MRKGGPDSGVRGLFRRPDVLAPSVAAAFLAMGCYAGFTAGHVRVLGGVSRLAAVWLLGVIATLIAAIAASLLLRQAQPGWVVIWSILATVFFLGATVHGWHQVWVVRQTTAFFLQLQKDNLSGAPDPGWLHYDGWTPLVQQATNVEEKLSRLRRRLAREYCGVILDHSPANLGNRHILDDPYALSSAKGSLDRAIRRLRNELPLFRKIPLAVRRDLVPARDRMACSPSLDHAFGSWALIHVYDQSEALARTVFSILEDERKLIDRMERHPERFTVQGKRLLVFDTWDIDRRSARPLRRLEARIQRFKQNMRCCHEPHQ